MQFYDIEMYTENFKCITRFGMRTWEFERPELSQIHKLHLLALGDNEARHSQERKEKQEKEKKERIKLPCNAEMH